GELRGVHGHVLTAQTERSLPACPAIAVRGRAARAVVEGFLAEEHAEFALRRDAVAIRDLIATAVVYRERERGRVCDLGHEVAHEPPDVARARRVREGVAIRAASLAVAVRDERALGGVALREARRERLLELGAPRAHPLLVVDAPLLGLTLFVRAALLETALEARLPLEEHLVDRLFEHRLGFAEAVVELLLERPVALCGHRRGRDDLRRHHRLDERLGEGLFELDASGEAGAGGRVGLFGEETHRAMKCPALALRWHPPDG